MDSSDAENIVLYTSEEVENSVRDSLLLFYDDVQRGTRERFELLLNIEASPGTRYKLSDDFDWEGFKRNANDYGRFVEQFPTYNGVI